MCGISGIVSLNETDALSRLISKMNMSVKHRGPDDEGIFIYKNRLALGHRRLAILDLSREGHQPMSLEQKENKYTIVYNGEIYNYIELRKSLQEKGYTFRSNTDTEVILAAYSHWGSKCVEKFNGMWAFCIHDLRKGLLFCSRDRFGIKPFYYAQVGKYFLFGSEIRQLLHFFDKKCVNYAALADYLIIGYENHTNMTFFDAIYKLPQSSNLIYDIKKNSFSICEYYNLGQQKRFLKSLDYEGVIGECKLLFEDAVKIRLRSDVKVGACLSGGLDSSSIVTFARGILNNADESKNFTAIHAKSADEKRDESRYAQLVADHTSIKLDTITPPSDINLIETTRDVLTTQEEPFGGPSVLMQYFVFQRAKQLGLKVMLDGQGGDEVFVGYERYYSSYLYQLHWWKMINYVFWVSKNSILTKKQAIQYPLYFLLPNIRKRVLSSRSSFLSEGIFRNVNWEHLDSSALAFKRGVKEMQTYELKVMQLPHLLRYEDKNAMYFSVETRLPMLDHRLVEFVLNLSENLKINEGWTKILLREVLKGKGLPNQIVWRKNKFGFEAPEQIWLSRNRKSIMTFIQDSEFLDLIIDKKRFNKQKVSPKLIWRLFSIALWVEIFNIQG